MSHKKIVALSLVAIASFMVAAATLVSTHEAFASCTITFHGKKCVDNGQYIKGSQADINRNPPPSNNPTNTQSQTVIIRGSG